MGGDDPGEYYCAIGLEDPAETPPALEHDRQLPRAAHRPSSALAMSPIRPPRRYRGDGEGPSVIEFRRDHTDMVATAVMPGAADQVL